MAKDDQPAEEAPTPPGGVPVAPSVREARELARRAGRRVAAPTSVADRHERLLVELVERVESRMNRRTR